MNYATSKLL